MKLYEIGDQLAALADQDDIPEEALRDTLEGLEGMLDQKVESIAHVILNLSADIEAIKTEQTRLANRKKSKEGQISFLKGYLITNMEKADRPLIKLPLFNVSLRSGPQMAVIDSEDDIPEDYKEIIETVKVDKRVLLQALKEGSVDGAHIETGKMGVVIK